MGRHHDSEPLPVSYARILQRRWPLPFALALAGMLAGAMIYAVRPTMYEARALLEFRTPNSGFLNVGDVSPVDADPALRGEIETAVKLLRSPGLGVETAQAIEGEAAALADATGTMRVNPAGSSRIVEVSARSRSARVAAEYVNGLAERYLARERGGRRLASDTTTSWFEEQLAFHREQLEQSERRLQEYAAEGSSPLLSPANLGEAERRLNELEGRLLEARSESLRLRAEAETLTADPAGSDSDMLRGQLARQAELARNRAELGALYTADHYRVRQVDSQLAAVEAAVVGEQQRLLARVERELEAARRREALLEESVAEHRTQVLEASALAVRYQTLEREAEANRALYQTFLERAKQAGTASAAPLETVRLIEPAAVAQSPVSAGPWPSVVAGLLAGLFLGLLGAVFLERVDRTFQAPGEISGRLGINEVGFVIEAAVAAERRMTTAGGPEQAATFESEQAAGRNEASQMSECIRGLRTSLTAATGEGRIRSLAVVSASMGEGKTTIALQLARSAREQGGQVLLVDGDLRRPSLHERLGLRNAFGLADLLASDGRMDAEVANAIQEAPGLPGLFLLSSGVAAFGGPGLLHSPRLASLLSVLQRRYQTVIFDTPPLLAVSDARVLAKSAEQTLLVVRAGLTEPSEAAEAVRLLKTDGARLTGAVLNGWDPSRARYGPYRSADAYYQEPAKGSFQTAA